MECKEGKQRQLSALSIFFSSIYTLPFLKDNCSSRHKERHLHPNWSQFTIPFWKQSWFPSALWILLIKFVMSRKLFWLASGLDVEDDPGIIFSSLFRFPVMFAYFWSFMNAIYPFLLYFRKVSYAKTHAVFKQNNAFPEWFKTRMDRCFFLALHYMDHKETEFDEIEDGIEKLYSSV